MLLYGVQGALYGSVSKAIDSRVEVPDSNLNGSNQVFWYELIRDNVMIGIALMGSQSSFLGQKMHRQLHAFALNAWKWLRKVVQ